MDRFDAARGSASDAAVLVADATKLDKKLDCEHAGGKVGLERAVHLAGRYGVTFKTSKQQAKLIFNANRTKSIARAASKANAVFWAINMVDVLVDAYQCVFEG